MRYEGPVYRPPSEAGSLLIQATIGCPHNRCRFCGMYKDKRFRVRPVAEVIEDLEKARECHGERVRGLFLPDGNTIVVKTPTLVTILGRARELFPGLERITVYGSARFILLKSLEDLTALRRAGLTRLHMGLESGDDETLSRMRKGATSEESVAAGRRVRDAGIELSIYYLVGLGGMDRWREHASRSAAAVNAMSPEFVRLRTYYPIRPAPLYNDIQEGRFELPDPETALRELEAFVGGLSGPTMLVSDHVSNYLNLTGRLPEDRPELLGAVREALGEGGRSTPRRLAFL